MIAGKQQRFVGQSQARESLSARKNLFFFKQNNFRNSLHGLRMEMDARTVFQGLCGRQQSQQDINAACRLQSSDRPQGHPARQVFWGNARQIQRRALTRRCLFRRSTVDLHAAHAHAPTRRVDLQLILFANCSSRQGTRYNRAEAFHREDAINGQPWQRCGVSRCD